MSEYVLGTAAAELARLEFQQEVWGQISADFLDRLDLLPGAWALELGTGPGLMLPCLRRKVGPRGRVLALDQSPAWRSQLERVIAQGGPGEVEITVQRVEDFEPEPESFDLIFARWLFCYLPDPRSVVARMARALKPGGTLAIQDYNHEGLSLFPECESFAAVVQATRAMHQHSGGDVWIAARIPQLFREAGLELVEYRPHVLAGTPLSPAYRWADAFFTLHAQSMHELGLVSASVLARFRQDWAKRKAEPSSVFFSPILVDCAGRKQGGGRRERVSRPA